MLKGPVCIIPKSRKITLWVKTALRAKLAIRAGNKTPTDKPIPIQGGQRFVIEVDLGAHELTVESSLDKAKENWRVELREPHPLAWLEEAKTLRKEGKSKQARKALQRKIAEPSVSNSPEQLGLATSLLARLALDTNDIQLAIDHFTKAIALYRQAGRLADVCVDTNALAFTLIYNGSRFMEARAILGDAPIPKNYMPSAYFIVHAKGLLAFQAGDLRTAMEHMSKAVSYAERLDLLDWYQRISQETLANILLTLGRRVEAEKAFENLLKTSPSNANPCKDRASFLTNLGWSRIVTLEAGEKPADSPLGVTLEALKIYQEKSCMWSARGQTTIRINLALTYLHLGEPLLAREQLDEAKKAHPEFELDLVLWELEIRARIAIVEKQFEKALGFYRELLELAAKVSSPEATWRATAGRARVLALMERNDEALDAFVTADKLLEDAALQVALGEGRASFVAQRQSSTREHISLLIKLNQHGRAMTVARQSRIQALQALDRTNRLAGLPKALKAQWDKAISDYRVAHDRLAAAAADDWRLPKDQLALARQGRELARDKARKLLDRAFSIITIQGGQTQKALQQPSEGELILTYYPLGDHWVGFAADRASVISKKLGALPENPTPKALSEQLLKPFGEKIRKAKRIRILPIGDLVSCDFHALPWKDDVLMTTKAVVYGLDFPIASAPVSGPSGSQKALFVADPQLNLPKAGEEMAAARKLFKKNNPSWQVVALQGKAAGAQTVKKALENADLFHFAGHGQFGGTDGWGSRLNLASGSALELGDIFALNRVPKKVVLMGCETGRAANTSVASLGVAQAFIAAGSKEVIASVRPIKDAVAAAFAVTNYSLPTPWEALLALKKQHPGTDWASFRVFVP